MEQVILTKSPDGTWAYTALLGGVTTDSDDGYASVEEALADALHEVRAAARLASLWADEPAGVPVTSEQE